MKHSYYIVSEKDIIPAYRIMGKNHAIEMAQDIALRDASWASVHEVAIIDGKEQYDKRIARAEWNQKTEKVETTIMEAE